MRAVSCSLMYSLGRSPREIRSRCRRDSGSLPLEVRVLHAAPRPVRLVPITPCPDVGRDPGHRPEWRPDARILIEDVWPEIDSGRYPIKRVVGDEVTVWADIFRDGHDKIAAVVKYGFEGAGLAGDAVRVFRERPLGGALPARPGRALALHDRGLDRPFRELARRSGQEAGGRAGHRARIRRGRAAGRGSDQACRRRRQGAAACDRKGIRRRPIRKGGRR